MVITFLFSDKSDIQNFNNDGNADLQDNNEITGDPETNAIVRLFHHYDCMKLSMKFIYFRNTNILSRYSSL